ncbi:hypothetical protein CDEST_12200 [Colletotrichum destructivum]|uniref:Uncharacterized protein n=1 Tax=Colletotrichum destructivum TaxID=34406 RepID=A0AAX4IVN8_9PEZI|nr:hypothetical protein CDEST_12200 [Colletotrichum destructivum]
MISYLRVKSVSLHPTRKNGGRQSIKQPNCWHNVVHRPSTTMSSPSSPSPDNMSSEEFQQLAASYEPLIESISVSKGVKAGQKTLQELDQFRFVEAPALFSQDAPRRTMDHDDVKLLVDWKL